MQISGFPYSYSVADTASMDPIVYALAHQRFVPPTLGDPGTPARRYAPGAHVTPEHTLAVEINLAMDLARELGYKLRFSSSATPFELAGASDGDRMNFKDISSVWAWLQLHL